MSEEARFEDERASRMDWAAEAMRLDVQLEQLRTELRMWAEILSRGTGQVPAVDVAWKLRQLAT